VHEEYFLKSDIWNKPIKNVLVQNKIGLSQMTYLPSLSLPTYLPKPNYLPIDLNAMCQHLIGLKLNDLN
jgi:hypothetical protein